MPVNPGQLYNYCFFVFFFAIPRLWASVRNSFQGILETEIQEVPISAQDFCFCKGTVPKILFSKNWSNKKHHRRSGEILILGTTSYNSEKRKGKKKHKFSTTKHNSYD